MCSLSPPQTSRDEVEGEEGEEEEQMCVELKLSLRSSTGQQLHDVSVHVTVEPPLSAHLSSHSFPAVGKPLPLIFIGAPVISFCITGSDPVEITLTVVCSPGLLAVSREVTLLTLYTTPAGQLNSSCLVS